MINVKYNEGAKEETRKLTGRLVCSPSPSEGHLVSHMATYQLGLEGLVCTCNYSNSWKARSYMISVNSSFPLKLTANNFAAENANLQCSKLLAHFLTMAHRTAAIMITRKASAIPPGVDVSAPFIRIVAIELT